MTFGFALVLSGFILLDAGWKGVTPFQVLQGIASTTKGPGGVISETGSDILAMFAGSPQNTGEGAEGEPAIRGLGKFSKKKLQKSERSLEQNHPELKPGIRIVAAVVMTAFPGLTITATTNGTHASGSYHYLGRAVDLAAPMDEHGIAEMNRAAKWISATLTHTLTEGIHNPGLSVKDKKKVPPSFWGSTTWAEHANHIHLAV